MKEILILISCHMIGDYVLQNDFLANVKGINNFILFVHSWLWTISISVGLLYLGLYSDWKFVFLIVGHFIIDKWKCNRKDKSKALTTDLYIDQYLHLMQLVAVLIWK